MAVQAKYDNMISWLRQWDNLPVQGTPEWLLSRQSGCGGSEFYQLINDEKNFVLQKCGLGPGMPNLIQLVWGSVFETVSRQLSQRIFSAEIYEAGSIPSIEHKSKTFSMDGLGLVKLRCSRRLGCRLAAWFYVLFEYKTLWSRVIKPDVIPDTYVPQVKSGMCDLGLPQVAIFVENVVRVCSMRQMIKQDATCNEVIHKATPQVAPIAAGFALISVNPETKVEVSDRCILDWLKRGGIDFGDIKSSQELLVLLNAIKSGYFRVVWSEPVIYGTTLCERSSFVRAQDIRLPDEQPKSLLAQYKALASSVKGIIGILPYKTIDINIVPIEKEVGYTASYSAHLEAAMGNVQKIRAVEGINEQWEMFLTMYEPRTIKTIDSMSDYID